MQHRRRKTDLGAYVRFAAVDNIGQEILAYGNVTGTFTSVDNFPCVHVVADGKQYSVDECAINLTDEEAAAYFVHKKRYAERVAEMRAEQVAKNQEYNATLAELAIEFLGPKINVEHPKHEPGETLQ